MPRAEDALGLFVDGGIDFLRIKLVVPVCIPPLHKLVTRRVWFPRLDHGVEFRQVGQVLIQPLGDDKKRLILKLQHVPVKGSVQCLSGGNPFMQNSGMSTLSPMELHGNVAFSGIITGDGDLRSLVDTVQYVKDVSNTNLVSKVEIRGQDVFLDGDKISLKTETGK